MAPPADPGQVAALVKRLTPLSQTERGELIRAQDWNVVVGAIVQLGLRAPESESADSRGWNVLPTHR